MADDASQARAPPGMKDFMSTRVRSPTIYSVTSGGTNVDQ